MLGHDPADPLKQPVEAEKIKDFYQKWYTPDAMTLLVVGNVDARTWMRARLSTKSTKRLAN